jgi:hypothetical protein
MNGLVLRLAIVVAASIAIPSVSAGGLAEPPVCSVSIDKQVDCGGGFIDIGDVNESCLGWNRSTRPESPAEDIAVRWVVENTGEDDLLNCTLAESNPLLLPQAGIGPLSPGEIDTQTLVRGCSDNLSMGEPDTADVQCDCATDDPGDPPEARTAFATDRASFACQTPQLNVLNQCVPQLDAMGDLTFDFEVTVRNPASENGATLDNCQVEDGVALGECSADTNPEPTLFADAGTVPPGSESEVIFSGNVVESTSCSVATVTCDVRGSVGEDGPKEITVRAPAQCVPMPPLEGCRQSEKQVLSIRNFKSKWKWKKGEATTKADFGNPTTRTDYEVCLYYGGFGSQKRPSCSNVPAGVGWKETKNGFNFKVDGNIGGVHKIKLKAGESGKASIQVKKSDERVSRPLDATVVVQISNSEGQCWESLFSSFSKNNLRKVDAK